MYVTNQNNDNLAWAFSDFQVLTYECTTCIKSKTSQISRQIGILIGIVGAVFFAMVVLLVIMLKIKEWRDKKQFSKRLKGEKLK